MKKILKGIYYNPVKHGYVKAPRDWLHSSFQREVARGFYDRNWGAYREPESIADILYE